MKSTIILLSAMLLVSGLAAAGVTNPDGFEGYELTDAWNPTVGGEGWIRYGEHGNPAAGNSVEIVAGSLPANTTQVLKVDSGANGENLTTQWYANIPDADLPITRTTIDFSATAPLFESEYRVMIVRRATYYWAYTWGITIGWGNWWGGGEGVPTAEFSTWEYNENPEQSLGPVFNREPMLGMEAFEPADGVWYVVEVEEDNGPAGVGNGQKSRARIYDKSTSPGLEDGWTSWLQHNPDGGEGTDYANGGNVYQYTNGVSEFDNWSMAAAPTLIDLDIKPGSDRNPVNLKSKGKLPVVLFGNEELDVSMIDLATLLLNGVPLIEKNNGSLFASLEDEDGDGLLDLVMHFGMQDLGIEAGMDELLISGNFLDGVAFEGSDIISIVGSGDANGDGVVSADDYASIQGNFGSTDDTGILGDATGDGAVSADDYASVQANFGATGGMGSVSVPEPGTLSLLAIGGLVMLRRCSAQVLRRRRS